MIGFGAETDQAVTMGDVYQEVDTIRKKHNISQFMSKSVSRKYAFELGTIPAESDYLKVLYPFNGLTLNLIQRSRTSFQPIRKDFFSCLWHQIICFRIILIEEKINGSLLDQNYGCSSESQKCKWKGPIP
jgi:hypothetical protein